MKKNYIIKTILTLVFITFFNVQSDAQIRVVLLDPETNAVTMHNYGGSTVNIGTYWLCNFPSYAQLSGMTVTNGSLNLASGAEVTVTSSVNFPVADAECGLYVTNASSFTGDMADYLQWGSSGHQREPVAVAANIWTAGTFINVPAPFQYTGDGNENGVNFWQTALSVEDFEFANSVSISPSPVNSEMRIDFNNNIQEGAISVVNMTGKTLLTQSIQNSDVERIDVSNLSTGLYIVSIKTTIGSFNKRFIKQ